MFVIVKNKARTTEMIDFRHLLLFSTTCFHKKVDTCIQTLLLPMARDVSPLHQWCGCVRPDYHISVSCSAFQRSYIFLLSQV